MSQIFMTTTSFLLLATKVSLTLSKVVLGVFNAHQLATEVCLCLSPLPVRLVSVCVFVLVFVFSFPCYLLFPLS